MGSSKTKQNGVNQLQCPTQLFLLTQMKEQNRVNRCLIFTANPGHFYQRQITPQRLLSCPPTHPIPLQTTRSAEEDRQQLPPPTGVAQDLPPMVRWPGRQQDHRHLVTQYTPFLGSFGTPRVKEETSLSGPVGSLEGIAGSG